MPPTTQDVLDLNTDDLTDANTLPIAGRVKAVTVFASKIENRLTKINQFLISGPPIDPQTMTDLQTLQASAKNILALTNGILAHYGPTST
jgi:hypothetical protein